MSLPSQSGIYSKVELQYHAFTFQPGGLCQLQSKYFVIDKDLRVERSYIVIQPMSRILLRNRSVVYQILDVLLCRSVYICIL